jgi:glutathionylspermidine synthase
MENKIESELRLDDKTFEEMREELTKKYLRKWVTIFRGKVVSVGETYDESARKAMQEYGEKPMVTRQVVPEGEEKYWIL